MARSVYEIIVQLEKDAEAKKGLEQVGIAAGLTGAALLAFSAKASQSAREYGTALAAVNTLADETTGTMEEFDESIRQTTKELDNNINRLDAMRASYGIASSGIKEQTEINYLLAESQKTAIGGFAELEEVTAGALAVYNSYGEALGENLTYQEKVDKILNGMINTQNEGVITAKEYANLIGNVASSAASAGITLEELNAAISVNTVKGSKASTTMAALTQVTASIAKPSVDAAEYAKQLGIEFDATSLRTKGLAGFLEMLSDAGVDTNDELVRLFGSVDAANAILRISGTNLDAFNKTLEVQKNNLTAVADGYEKLKDTDAQRLVAAQNAFNDALIDLGQGVQMALLPAMEALTKLISVFNELPTPVKQAIGLTVAISGVTLTAAGSIALFTASVGASSVQLKALSAFMKLNVAQTLAMGKANIFTAKSMSAMALNAKALAVSLGPIVALAATVYLGIQHLNNVRTEEANNQLASLQQQTQILADKASTMAGRMERTGKAIPDQEFADFIALLEQADAGTGVLRQQIDALTRKQESYKNSSKGATDATNKQAEANKEVAETEEDKAERIEKAIKANDELQQSVENSYKTAMMQAEASAKSTEDLVTRQNAAEQDRTTFLKDALRQRANLEGVSAAEKKAINEQIAQLDLELLQKQKENNEKLIELKKDAAIASLDAEKALLELNGDSNIGALRANAQERYEVLKEDISRRLAEVKAGSDDERLLLAERKQLEADYQGELKTLKEREQKLIEEHNQRLRELAEERYEAQANDIEREKVITERLYKTGQMSFEEFSRSQVALAAKAYQAEKDYLDKRLTEEDLSAKERSNILLEQERNYSEYVETLQNLDKERFENALSIEQQITENLNQQLALRAQSITAVNSYKGAVSSALGSYSSQLGEIQKALEEENLSSEKRNRLQRVAGVLLSNLRAMGIAIKDSKLTEANVTKIQEQVELRRLVIQQQQLQNQKQILALETRAQALTLEGEIRANQLRLASGNLTEVEANKARLDIAIASDKLGLLEKEYNLKQKSLKLDEDTLNTQIAISAAMSGQRTPTRVPSAQTINPFAGIGGTGGQTGQGLKVDPQSYRPLADAQREGTQALSQSIGGVKEATESSTVANEAQLTVLRQVNTNLSAIKANTDRMISQLGNIWTVINNLPPRIAASIPRPPQQSNR